MRKLIILAGLAALFIIWKKSASCPCPFEAGYMLPVNNGKMRWSGEIPE